MKKIPKRTSPGGAPACGPEISLWVEGDRMKSKKHGGGISADSLEMGDRLAKQPRSAENLCGMFDPNATAEGRHQAYVGERSTRK